MLHRYIVQRAVKINGVEQKQGAAVMLQPNHAGPLVAAGQIKAAETRPHTAPAPKFRIAPAAGKE